MSDAVYDELGMKSKQIGAYFKCPSNDLAGLGITDEEAAAASSWSREGEVDANQPTVSVTVPGTVITPWLTTDQAPPQILTEGAAPYHPTPFDPFALQKLVSAPSDYTYHTPPGQFVGPPAESSVTRMTPYGPITPASAFDPFALQKLVSTPSTGSQATSSAKNAADAFAAVMKGATPAAQAYIQMQAAQAMARNQPIHVPVPYSQSLLSRGSLAPWLIGGLALLTVLGFVVYSAQKR